MPDSALTNAAISDISLTLLATSDVHAHILSYDYYEDRPVSKPALSRLASLIDRERQATQNLIIVDNGDFLQGTPLSDLFIDKSPSEVTHHPVIEAMNLIGYDAVALGNHEFNVPLPRLNEILRQANFPLLCANLEPIGRARRLLDGLWRKHILLPRRVQDRNGELHDLTIGLFGVMPPQVTSWDHSRVSGRIAARDSVEAAREAIHELKQAGADLVIGLAHTGLSEGPEHSNMENAGLPIARLSGLDALVLGHTHLTFPGPGQPDDPAISAPDGTVANVPAIMPGAAAAYLGKIQLDLACDQGEWSVRGHKAELLPVLPNELGDPAESPAVQSAVSLAHGWVQKQIRKPVGHTKRPIHSFLGFLPDCNAVRTVAEAQFLHAREVLAKSPYADLPILSAGSPQKCGGRSGPGHFTHIPAGPLAQRHIADLQYFPNDVSILLLNGSELRDWLEMSASAYHQVPEGASDHALCDPEFPPYNCDTVFGLTYRIDLSVSARFSANGDELNPDSHRIRDLRFQGHPLSATQDFALVMNNYRSGGGGGYPHVSEDRLIHEGEIKIRDLLIAHLSSSRNENPGWPDPWQFEPIPGATVYVDTSPDFAAYLDQPDYKTFTPLGVTEDGFLRLRLSLAP